MCVCVCVCVRVCVCVCMHVCTPGPESALEWHSASASPDPVAGAAQLARTLTSHRCSRFALVLCARARVCVCVCVRVCMHVCTPGPASALEWHSASASPDADVRAQLAHHFEVARDAAEPVRTLGAHVSMSQVLDISKIVRLRWYDAATKLIWDNWGNEEGGTLPDRPPRGAAAWLFGMPGVGKTMWRNFMAIHILRNDDGAGIIVFDRATGSQRGAVLVRHIRGDDGSLHVQVARTGDRQLVESTATAAKRVFHLLDCSNGLDTGCCLELYPTEYYTILSSAHHETLLKRATEYQKETLKSKVATRSLILFAPPSTLDELVDLERRCYGELALSADVIAAIVEKYGPVARRLADCQTAGDQQEVDMTIAAKAKAWCRNNCNQQFTIPTSDDIINSVSDTLVVCRTTFDLEGATGASRFKSAGMEWASSYVRHLVADAIYRHAKETVWGLSIGGPTPPDVRGRLAEELMLRLFEVGRGQQAHVEVKLVKGRLPKGLAALRDGITTCTVLWMRTGQEKETLAKALGHVAGGPVLIRPFSHSYPGVDALLVVAAGTKAKKTKKNQNKKQKDFLLLALQATLADSHPLSAKGAVTVGLWAELCATQRIAFDSLVYLLPRTRYVGWIPQDGVPAGLPQLAWTQNTQTKVVSM